MTALPPWNNTSREHPALRKTKNHKKKQQQPPPPPTKKPSTQTIWEVFKHTLDIFCFRYASQCLCWSCFLKSTLGAPITGSSCCSYRSLNLLCTHLLNVPWEVKKCYYLWFIIRKMKTKEGKSVIFESTLGPKSLHLHYKQYCVVLQEQYG